MTSPALEARLHLRVGRGERPFTVDAELLLAEGVLVLFGPSGSGKSLTLQAVAGLLRPARGFVRVAGETLFDGERHVHVAVHERRIGYVPQDPSLFPFLDVSENVIFGLPRAKRNAKSPAIMALLEELGLTRLAHAKPADLSGGERQRVALARALAVEPWLLLLDEPFAAIDQEGRAELRQMLRATVERRKVPVVLVTHDPNEAVDLGTTLVRFERGRTTTSGEPKSLLQRGEAVIVSGVPVEAASSVGNGRGTVALRDATVEGPMDLLERTEDGRVHLTLRTRPRGPRT